MLHRRIFAALFMLCAAVLAVSSVSEAKNIIVSDAQASGVKYEADGYTEHYHPEIATLRDLFAKVVESGDVVYIGENWGGALDGNEEELDGWDNESWSARFIVTEPIEISKDVEIYASCTGKLNDFGTVEVVNLTKNGDMKEDLTTFEGKGKSQIFRITGGAKVTIANLRIHGANLNGNGAAISVSEGSDVTVKNCWIVNNTGRTGTGIYANASKLTVQSCDIRNNKNYASAGCGIAIENGSYASITNCTITSNDTLDYSSYGAALYGNGGGIAVLANCSADITSCDISNNIGYNGGGVYVHGDSSSGISTATIKDCKISGNFSGSTSSGGGIAIDYASAAITNCTISGNIVSGEYWATSYGGGIDVSYPRVSVTITDCIITDNSANSYGGGVHVDGTVGDSSYVAPVITNCLISNNSAALYGGGIALNTPLVVNNCTIIGNKNPGIEDYSYGNERGGGGGIYVNNGSLLMTNSTVTKNSTYYGSGGGGINYSTSGGDNMLSNCSIVENSARNGGIEIQRDGGSQIYRIPFINSLIFNSTSPDRTINNPDADTIYDRSRMMFFNCAVPEALTLPERSPSFDIVLISSWDNPVSSTEEINGITHTVYRIEDNPALKPIVGAGANKVIYSNEYYTRDVNYTSPSLDQLGITRVNSPDIGAVEKAVTVPVLSADASIHVVVSTELTPLTIADTEPNKALTWTISGDLPSGVTASSDANGMTYTLSGAPTVWGDYSFSVIASNAKGSHDVKVSMTVYTPPVMTDSADLKLIKGATFTQTISADSGNHLVWTVSGDIPAGLDVASSDEGLTFTGTPTAAGDYECTFTASNLAGSDDVSVSFTVYEVPVLSSSSLAIHTSKDKAMTSQTITATAGNHLVWSVSGTLPAGMSISSSDNTATITGTPTAAGDYSFTVTAANYAGSASATVSLTVYEAPELSSGALTINAVEENAMTARSININAGNHLSWRISGTFPDGLRYTSSDTSFTISGTPDSGTAGSYDCTFTASNLAGSATLRVTLSVYAMPVLSGDSVATLYEGEAASITVTATSGNNLSWTHSGTLPDGLSVSDSNNSYTISGTPAEGTRGSYSYTFTAENYAGSATKTITLNVFVRKFEVTSSDVSSATALSEFLDAFTDEQAAAIESLKLNEYFTDLSGLERLTGLTALDLTGATALTAINLSSNDTITTLDISGNDSITELNISGGAFAAVNAEGCSALSVVNAENCADLETLLCGSCSISELYLAGCTSLKILDFSLNAIRKFDARGFTALETLECEGQTITGQVLTKSFAFRDFLNDSDDENVNNITGFNASGQEIDAVYDEATGLLTFTQLPYRITYNYMTLDTLSMDVTVYGETAPALSGSSFTINGTVGTAISALTITASSGDNLVWTTSGSLPSGLSGAAASDGMSYTISGTPNSAGTFTYTVTASNSAGSADAVVNVNIAAAPVTPEPEPEPEPEPVISPDVEPESGDVEPVSGDVEPVSGDVEPVSGDVEPVSGDVEPVSGDVEPVSGDVEPVSGDVEPVSGDIEPVSGDIEPVSGDIEPEPTPGDESEDVRPTPTPTPTPSDNSGDIEPEPTPTPSDNSGDIEPEPTPTPNDDSGDIEPEPTPTSGDDEPEVEPVSAEIEKPAVDVTSRSVINTITEIFRAISQTVSNLINGGTEIAELPEEASGSERTIDDLSDEDLAAIPEGQTPAVIIPIIVVDAAKIYVFGVAIPNLQPGAPIFWNPMAQSLTAAGIFSAADYDNTSAYTFLDDDGHETAVVPANQHINVAAYLEPGKTYAPIITTAASSSGNNGNGDNNNSEGSDETAHVGSSGGGCYSGMSLIASVIACGMFLLKRKQS